MIQAGAGSGKTKTLTHRIAYLIASKKATPYDILAVTFTNKAAKEMRGRVAQLLGEKADDRGFMPYMGTFHGICVRLLRQDGEAVGVPRSFVIFDETDRQAAVKHVNQTVEYRRKDLPCACAQQSYQQCQERDARPRGVCAHRFQPGPGHGRQSLSALPEGA